MNQDDDQAAELRSQLRAEARYRRQYLAHPNPRDPDYPGDPPDTDHQYTGQQPLDLD